MSRVHQSNFSRQLKNLKTRELSSLTLYITKRKKKKTHQKSSSTHIRHPNYPVGICLSLLTFKGVHSLWGHREEV